MNPKSTFPKGIILFFFIVFSLLYGNNSLAARDATAKEASTQSTDSIFLPLIFIPPEWKQLGAENQIISDIAIDGDQLYFGDRTAGNGGIHRLAVDTTNCYQNVQLSSVLTTEQRIYSVDVRNSQGIAASLGGHAYYSGDVITRWSELGETFAKNTFSVVFAGNTLTAYAGADDGVYSSASSGVLWQPLTQQLKPEIQLVNKLWFDDKSTSLWIGTSAADVAMRGPWLWQGGNNFVQISTGLDASAQEVWDFAYDASLDRIFIGTSNGVYWRDKNNIAASWTPMGVPVVDKAVFSLALNDGLLYAGVQDNGVWQTSISNTNSWTSVTGGADWSAENTVFDLAHYVGNGNNGACKGMIAATNNGVWVLR